MKRIFCLLLIFCLLSQIVAGLGVAPGKIERFFEPGAVSDFQVKIVREADESTVINILPKGEYAHLVQLSESQLIFAENESEKKIKVKVTMPEKLEPGYHTIDLVVFQLSEGTKQVAASVSVVSKLNIFSPYPGKYLDAELMVSTFSIEQGGNFIVKSTSRGSENIDNAKTDLNIYDEHKIIESLSSDKKQINSLDTVLFTLPWLPKVRAGEYVAKAKVVYDEKTVETSRAFQLGRRIVRLEKFEILSQSTDSQLAFGLNLFNDWNRVSKVHAILEFKNGINPIAEAPTTVSTFEPYEKQSLNAYWDINNIPFGNYNVLISIFYDDNVEKHERVLTLSEEGATLGDAIYRRKADANLLVIFASCLLLILVIFIVLKWFMLGKKTK